MIDTDDLNSLSVEELRAGIVLQRKEIDRLRRFEFAFKEWSEKTEWVQETAPASQSAHPEERCEQCRGPNIVWNVNCALWAEVVPEDGILCPICFVKRAEQAKGFELVWELRPASQSAEPVGCPEMPDIKLPPLPEPPTGDKQQ